MSKCIDTMCQNNWDTGRLGRLRHLFRGDTRTDTGTPGSDTVSSAENVAPPAAAPAMLMASRDIAPLIARTTARLEDWRTVRAGRRQLMALDDRLLKDIGISRCDAEHEFRKPFWRL